MEGSQVSRIQKLMPTYIGVLNAAIDRCNAAIVEAMADHTKAGKVRGAVIALWAVLPPEVEQAVRKRLNFHYPDNYIMARRDQAVREKRKRNPHATNRELWRAANSAVVHACIAMLRVIINELHRHGWLVKEETTRVWRER